MAATTVAPVEPGDMRVADDVMREQAQAEVRRQLDTPEGREAAANHRVEISDARRERVLALRARRANS